MRLTIFLSLVMLTHLSAQTETTKWYYQLDGVAETDKQNQIQGQTASTILKLINAQRLPLDDFLGGTLRAFIEKEELPIYKNEKAINSVPKDKVKIVLDSVYFEKLWTIDYETLDDEEITVETTVRLFPTEKTIYQLVQNWSFDVENQKNNNSISTVNVNNYGELNQYGFIDDEEVTKLFSIKNKVQKSLGNSEELFENDNIIWAKSINHSGTFKNKELRKSILAKAHLSKNKVVDIIDFEILNEERITKLLEGSVDTILDYRPDENDPQVTVIRGKDMNAESIMDFRIMQDIYFNRKTKSFTSKILAIAPLKQIYDEMENTIGEIPIFWIVYEDDFFNK